MADDGSMKWSRAVHHLEELAHVCADMAGRPATIFPLRVTALWAFGNVLNSRDDLDWLSVVLAVDLPLEEVPGSALQLEPTTGPRRPGCQRTPSWPCGGRRRHPCGTIASAVRC